MFIRPGKTITTFLRIDRKKIVKPLIFLLFNAVIFTFTLQILKLNYQFFNIVLSGNTLMQNYVETESINKWLNSHIAYTAFFVGLFFAMLLRLFFRKTTYNFFEILIVLCYAFGQMLLINSVWITIAGSIKSQLLMDIGLLITNLYVWWAISQVFGAKKPMIYIKVLVSGFLGILCYHILLTFIAYIFYLLK